MLNFDANIKYVKGKEYTKEEKQYLIARTSFDLITSEYYINDAWTWNVINKGLTEKGVMELDDDELEEEWIAYKDDKDYYGEEENEHQ
jgi:hypothetical protein